MAALMETDVSALAGPKGKHGVTRTAVRHGRERGSVTLGGRWLPVTRPRVRTADGSPELPVASYELFSSTEILGKLAMEKMLAGLSPGATRSASNRSGSRSSKHLLRQVGRLCRADSWR
ncbi:hypothetical protein BH09ACT7_BH09ACT7_61050 [soil metagenome]